MRAEIEQIAYEAGELVAPYFEKPNLKIITKPDGSPVTEADLMVSDFFIDRLASFNLPVVTEERTLTPVPKGDFFIIDPIDGTRYFIDGNEHFAILVALISGGKPVTGITYFPLMDLMFSAELGQGSYLNGERITNDQTRQGLIAFSSGFHRKEQARGLLKELNVLEVREQESILKMCYMAQGQVDFYPRFGKTYEWDTASAQILLEEAGCEVRDIRTMEPLAYGKPQYLNHGFVCYRRDLGDKISQIFKNFEWKRDPHGPRHQD